MNDSIFIALLTLLGLLLGSFGNVVIWRVPRGESVNSPGSHCPGCDAPIAWYHNIPVLSYVALGGRCRACGIRIPVRYPLVELVSAALFAFAALRFGAGAQAVFAAALLWGLLVLSIIDMEHYRLPNPIVGGLAIVGLAGAAAAQITGAPVLPLVGLASAGILSEPLAVAAVGALAAGGLSLAVAEFYERVRKQTGLGMGDVKLLAVFGLFMGFYSFMALVVGSLLGIVYAMLRPVPEGASRATLRMPFGAFLAIGAIVTVLVGPAVWGWYLGVAGLG